MKFVIGLVTVSGMVLKVSMSAVVTGTLVGVVGKATTTVVEEIVAENVFGTGVPCWLLKVWRGAE